MFVDGESSLVINLPNIHFHTVNFTIENSYPVKKDRNYELTEMFSIYNCENVFFLSRIFLTSLPCKCPF